MRGGSVTLGWYQEPETLNPFLFTQSAAGEICNFMLEGFLDYDDSGKAYGYRTRLAQEVPTVDNGGVSADGTVVIYRLKDGLRWSDGHPVTSDDVRFTWQAIIHPRNASPNTAGYTEVDSVECPDALTVIVRYKRFYASFMNRFDCILPKHATGPVDNMSRWPYNNRPIGTGPFCLKEWVRGERLTMVPNPFYRGRPEKPYLDSVLIRFLPSRQAGLDALAAGGIDGLWYLAEADLPSLEAIPDVRIVAAPGPSAERLVLNLADPVLDAPTAEDARAHPHPILGDPRVREAIELAIDKQEIVDTCLWREARVGTNELHVGWAKCVTPPSEFAPDRAACLLEAAGWALRPDGLRVAQGARRAPDGTPLRLRLHTTANDALRERVAQLLIQYLRRIGIALDVVYVPPSALFASWQSGAFRKHGQFDMLMYTAGPERDPHTQIEDYFASWRIPTVGNGGGGTNYSRWCNVVADEHIRLAGSTLDPQRRRQAYLAVMREVVADRPHIYLYSRTTLYAHRTHIRGPVTNIWQYFGWNAGEWQLDDSHVEHAGRPSSVAGHSAGG